MNVSRVLIIGPSNIGDAILASDVIASARRRHPEAHLTLVVGERATALFTDDPRIQTLVNLDRFRSPWARIRLAAALWRYQPHVVIDLRHTLYPLLLKPLQAWRYVRQPPRRLIHMRDRHRWKLYVQTAARDPQGDAGSTMPLWFSERDVAHVDALWRRWELAGRRIALIAPGARSHIKRWTAQGFAEVADRLIDAGLHVLFSGEPDEEMVVDEIAGLMRGPAHSLVGLVTIRQLGVVMQRVQLVITNDSGALHLASAVGTPTVAVFGPTDPAKYGPTAPASQTVRRHLFCAPCEQSLCRFSHECMRFIGPDEVFAAARSVLPP